MQQTMQVLVSKATVEWYTPPKYIDLVRAVLGTIDLDPASSALPQTWIQARRWYGLDLSQFMADPTWTPKECQAALRRESRRQLAMQPAWTGRVFLNSPFDDTPIWATRLAHEVASGATTAAIQLCNSNLGYVWFEALWRRCVVCCVKERIRFVHADGTQGAASKQGQTFAYYGPRPDVFARVFRAVGRIVRPEDAA